MARSITINWLSRCVAHASRGHAVWCAMQGARHASMRPGSTSCLQHSEHTVMQETVLFVMTRAVWVQQTERGLGSKVGRMCSASNQCLPSKGLLSFTSLPCLRCSQVELVAELLHSRAGDEPAFEMPCSGHLAFTATVPHNTGLSGSPTGRHTPSSSVASSLHTVTFKRS